MLQFAPVARSGTTPDLQKREQRQLASLHRHLGTITFFRHHPRLAHTATGRREARRSRIWVKVIRRELAETRAQMHPPNPFPVPAWWLPGALCVHSHESSNWHISNPPYADGMQFVLSTWISVGGTAASWQSASPAEQLYRSYLLWKSQGWSPWPNTSRACGLG